MKTSRYASFNTPIFTDKGGVAMHIVLVSGWGKADFLWRRYRRWFEAEGFTTSVVNTASWNFGPIQSSAKALARHINELKHPPVLVGHSCGGLIIRYYMARYYANSQTDVAACVSIGSPLSGSPLARLAPWSSSACQMVPGSPFLRRFDSYADPEVPWLSVKCNYDLIVPGAFATLGCGEDYVDVSHSHVSSLFSKSVWGEVKDFAFDAVGFEFEEIPESESEDADDE